MLFNLAIILLILWLLGVVSGYTLSDCHPVCHCARRFCVVSARNLSAAVPSARRLSAEWIVRTA
jgi:hypothetical protein